MFFWFLLPFFYLFYGFSGYLNVSERNALKMKAQAALESQNYGQAAQHFDQLYKISNIIDPATKLDMAHTFFKINDTLRSKRLYTSLQKSNDEKIASSASNQLGILAIWQQDSLRALHLFLTAIEKQPDNTLAQKNYEYLKKLLPNTSPPPPTYEEENQEQNSHQTELTEDKEDKLKKQENNPQNAMHVLDAMQKNEIQYIQQRRRRP